MSWMEMVREFHDKFGVAVSSGPNVSDRPTRALRIALIKEEFEEFEEAAIGADVVGMADALADLAYVVCGAALTFGIDLDAVFKEVHRSNMSKLWADGTIRHRADGKVLKPPTYSPADVAGVLGNATSNGPDAPATKR